MNKKLIQRISMITLILIILAGAIFLTIWLWRFLPRWLFWTFAGLDFLLGIFYPWWFLK